MLITEKWTENEVEAAVAYLRYESSNLPGGTEETHGDSIACL
jgi:hypothetical protein